jgi:hypothetical protein
VESKLGFEGSDAGANRRKEVESEPGADPGFEYRGGRRLSTQTYVESDVISHIYLLQQQYTSILHFGNFHITMTH